MKLLSADGRVIKILRQALLSSNKSTVGIAMEIVYTILDAGKKQMPELSHFSDFWGTSNRDLDKDDRSLKAESTEQIKALEEMLETKNEEINRLKTDLKKERDSCERQLLENNLSNDEVVRTLKKKLRKSKEDLQSNLSIFEERLKHKESVINLKELSFARMVEQVEGLRSERDSAEKESGLLRRKLRALENRIDEIAKQLLESYETGAEEVAKRDKQLQRLRHSHKDEIENIKKQNQSSISQLRAELENSMKTLTASISLKESEVEKLKSTLEKQKENLVHKDQQHDNVVKQLVLRLNKMIIAYEKK